MASVLEQGWDATTMAHVRREAGVSNGSLFHHFPQRGDLAAAVIATALHDHQHVLLTALARSPTALDGVTGVVEAHLGWIGRNRELARMLLGTGTDQLRAQAEQGALAASRAFFDQLKAWLRDHGWTGEPSFPVLHALWIGSAQEYARAWLAAPDRYDMPNAAPALAAGAWAALAPLLESQP
ncbi:TetR/AcrR family transcriptional regulator [Actinomycetospora sp. NBRC 106375]|uniref:TetR/AcrR family transcriptional regulator n=1 Tax=Actinomycetospora sp. NBRC 106375 TaxID=3032207 RepID=UPI0025574596|nr:TetR/AcrR family transcriptional regulator [Actinomycetospora sp. NBRC 106375]